MLNQKRVLIENVLPQLDNGQFFIKRTINQGVAVTADVFADGHDVLQAAVQYKHEHETTWTEIRMTEGPNDAFDAFLQFKIKAITLTSLRHGLIMR
jgi:starch synthase (maltosyl-transferring)